MLHIQTGVAAALPAILQGISSWLFKLVTPILISFDVMTATAIKLPLILQTGIICTFNSYLQIHFTNLKFIVTILPKSHCYSFYVKKIQQEDKSVQAPK